ncbi:protein phosphatase 2C domain-containing protein [Novosphingobium aerophilum]|uniref:protein phosphatase 2C domain-containing protein n=1 Tax=Novosphingobium aerophilum TaxID=2839843 RepID=UPI003FD3C953
MLRIEIAASDGQGEVNDDRFGYQGDAAWVIDGATGIGPSLLGAPSDASWLARKAGDLLADTLAQAPEIPTVELLRQVMAGCAEALAREQVRPADGPHEHPSAAFAMVRIIGGEAEFTTLADCRIAACESGGGARLFGSSALDAIEARTIEAMKAIVAEEGDLGFEALKARLMPGLRANRRLMNRDGGYWVLGTQPAAADHLWQVRMPVRPGQRFAIASDGFLRLVELFGAAAPADLLAISGQEDWARWLGLLRDLEDEPDSLHRFARVKPRDDASLVVCSWEDAR